MRYGPLISLLLALVAAQQWSAAQSISPPFAKVQPQGASASAFTAGETLDALIETAIREGKLPGAVLLVGHNGQVVYRKAYGERALVPKREIMTVDTIFDCASLTKVIATTSSVMKLYERGKIRPDDKVTQYLPAFQNGQSDITIRDLMTHYSGLRPDLNLEPPWSGYENGIERALSDPPARPRETKFVYSDINFILMGEIVLRLSGQTLDEFARTQIFEPLGMRDTEFRPREGLRSRIAPTERQKDGQILRGIVHDPTSRYMGGVAGHAGMFSTADDLGRFCQMMLNRGVNPMADQTHPRRLFQPETVALFTSAQTPLGMPAIRGFGWDIDSPYSGTRGDLFPAGSSFGHTGFTGTSIWIDPGSQTYVILLANAVHPVYTKNITPLRRSVATAVAAAVGYKRKQVLTGLDVLQAQHFRSLLGKRVGLITNPTGVNGAGRRNIDVMRESGVHITALFSPEHGFRGAEDKPNIAATTDRATGIKVYSLFAKGSLKPSPEMLRDVDVMVFDIADVGARFYTYVTTMAYAMEACAKAGKPFLVLDRPDPITGIHVEGPVLQPQNASFIGYFPLPLRHGMTVGELARMFNAENKIDAELTVVPMQGWKRSDWFDSTGLPWVNPSPNIRSLEEALLYPGLAMLEYSENYSVGRGTATPFKVIGAPWIHGRELAAYLNGRKIPGVRIEAATFRPDSNHYAGVTVEGVGFSVVDRDALDTALLGLEIGAALQKLYPGKINFEANLRLIGNQSTVTKLGRGDDPGFIRAAEEPQLQSFASLRRKYLLY